MTVLNWAREAERGRCRRQGTESRKAEDAPVPSNLALSPEGEVKRLLSKLNPQYRAHRLAEEASGRKAAKYEDWMREQFRLRGINLQ